MQREPQELVEQLKKEGIEIYSFSRLECINNCLYEAYRTYIMDDKKNQIPNIYGILGGKIHDVLEGITNGKNTEKDLLPAMNEELSDMDMLGIEFPKGRDGSDSIREGWIADMTNFCNTYKAPKGRFETEKFFLYKTPKGNYVQGFIDLTKFHKDKTISIYDYKTSSMYKGEDIKKHGRQLVLYALGKEQEGYKIKEIAWLMLKYVEVSYVGKKTQRSKEETEITKVIERKNLIKELEGVIRGKMQKYGADEIDIDIIMEEAYQRNKIPEILACEFKIKPYVMKYELTDKIKEECNNYIDETITKWESLDSEMDLEYPPIDFVRTNKNGKKVQDTFYCSQLCGYSKVCPHYLRFIDTFNPNSEDEDLW